MQLGSLTTKIIGYPCIFYCKAVFGITCFVLSLALEVASCLWQLGFLSKLQILLSVDP